MVLCFPGKLSSFPSPFYIRTVTVRNLYMCSCTLAFAVWLICFFIIENIQQMEYFNRKSSLQNWKCGCLVLTKARHGKISKFVTTGNGVLTIAFLGPTVPVFETYFGTPLKIATMNYESPLRGIHFIRNADFGLYYFNRRVQFLATGNQIRL